MNEGSQSDCCNDIASFPTLFSRKEELFSFTINQTIHQAINESVIAALNYIRRDAAEDRAYFVLSGRQYINAPVQQSARIVKIYGDDKVRSIRYANLKCASRLNNVASQFFGI